MTDKSQSIEELVAAERDAIQKQLDAAIAEREEANQRVALLRKQRAEAKMLVDEEMDVP